MIYNILNKYKVEIYNKFVGDYPFININGTCFSKDGEICDSIETESDACNFLLDEICKYEDKTNQMYNILSSYTIDEVQGEVERKKDELLEYIISLNRKEKLENLIKEKNLTEDDITLINQLYQTEKERE